MHKYVIEKQFLTSDRAPQYFNFLSSKFQNKLTKECTTENEAYAFKSRPKPIQTEGWQLVVKTTIQVAQQASQSISDSYRHKEY